MVFKLDVRCHRAADGGLVNDRGGHAAEQLLRSPRGGSPLSSSAPPLYVG